jgi:predicted TIM-barrel fold metal-dependent hydrolase
MIVDAHAHIMRRVHGQTGSGPTRSLPYGRIQVGDQRVSRLLPPLNRATGFPPEMLLEHMDWAGVDKAVLLQGSFYGTPNHYVAAAVKRWPDRFIGAAFVDPRSRGARRDWDRLTKDQGFTIVKFEMSEGFGFTGLYPDLSLVGDEMAWMWEAAERQNLVIVLDLGAVGSRSYQTAAVREIIARHPRLRVVIAHLAQPPIAHPNDARLDELWQEQIELGRSPNVWFDLSALPAYASPEDYPYASARRYIERAVTLIGAEKLMWGTDLPGLLTHATYPQLLGYVSRHCDFLSADALRGVLGETAWRVYGPFPSERKNI